MASTRKWPGGRASIVLAILVGSWSAPSMAQSDPSQDSGAGNSAATRQGQEIEAPPSTLTGEWGGLRTTLRDKGIDLTGNFKGEYASNVQGGTQSGSTE